MSDRHRGFPLLGVAGVFLLSVLAGFAITECGESDAQPVSLLGGPDTPAVIAMTGEGISARGLLTTSDDEAELLAHRNTRIVVSAEPEP